ncbi:helix-turn-helix domain-containing protein [Pseudactinotalea sp.]|uniref:helix-turn-helix domain-containing protein n=1 Tax=Pseudactinotalea sp. TaxID=1926260 RepID=UPI003B3A5C41
MLPGSDLDGGARQIWPARSAWTTSGSPLLFWVAAGRARVEIDGRRLPLQAGEAALVRPGVRYRLSTEHGSAAIPVLLPLTSSERLPAADLAAVHIPSSWQVRLVHEFVMNLGYLQGTAAQGSLLDLVAAAGVPFGGGTGLPRLPRSAHAFAAAHRILAAPERTVTAPEMAAEAGVSERTLQRHFIAETGHAPIEWRTRARMAIAGKHLEGGRSIAWIAAQVGYATPSGFARAFHAATGQSPSEYRRMCPGSRRGTSPGEVAARIPEDSPGGALPWLDHPPPLPASSSWPRVNGAHVAVWVYRGTAEVDVGGRHWQLHQGDAIVLPAGLRNRVSVAVDSLLLPLGFRAPGQAPVSVSRLGPCHLKAVDEPWLLAQMVACYTPLRPAGHDPVAAFDLVAARSAAMLPGLTRSGFTPGDEQERLRDLADALEVDQGQLRSRFRELTGMSMATWRSLHRMTQAREQLTMGVPASAVARALGYAHLPAFSRAFRAVHGLSPRQYLGTAAARSAAAQWRAEHRLGATRPDPDPATPAAGAVGGRSTPGAATLVHDR